MTSKDVRDILQLGDAPGPSQLPPKRSSGPPDPRVKRPDGITRELYALIGDNAPSLALAQAVKPKFKERLKRTGPQVKWTWTSFSIPSRAAERPDDEGEKDQEARKKLTLRHWIRDLPPDHVPGAPDHKFAKFNTSSQPYSYTTEEYVSFLREDDWTKEETDYLFQLAREYDLRFIVMADRWDYPSQRSVDELKARYYAVCRRLVRNRPASDESAKAKMMQDLSFDITRELDRKAYLRSLLQRTPAQAAEEDYLYVESRRLEQTYQRQAQERADLLKLLGGREGIGITGGLNVGAGGGGSGGAAAGGGASGTKAAAASDRSSQNKKKNAPGWELEGVNGAGLPDGWAGEGSKRKATPAQDLANCVERHPAPSVSATKATLHPSVSLRSSRITQPKQAVLVKVQAALTELKISTQLVMPTRLNVQKLDSLQSALTQVVELKKAVDRIEQEIKTVRKRKDALSGIVDTSRLEDQEPVDKKPDEAALRNKRSASASSSTAGSNKRARH